ncbi:hypothetical protein [Novosphingobium rosa]|uniref:hypothetical protein n=1 Tax=Novosphingobium rosa TaxID=76978 RepID=UPI00082B3B09|nr:hypothetical protein [Novosphingobium rosa]
MIRTDFPASRLARWLPLAAPAVLTGMLLIGLLLPLYTDEVGWRLQERAGIDGVDKLFSQQCGPNTLAVPPWFMMPVRWYSAFFNLAWPDPFAVRLSGVAHALCWVAMLLVLIRQATADHLRRSQLTMLCCGLMGLGVMPWLLVWSRPEQPIILCATASLLIAMGQNRPNSARPWAPVAILLLGVIALSYHFKALILMPLFMAAMIAAAPTRQARAVRAMCTIALTAAATIAARYWFGRMACPGDPILAADHAKQSLALQLLGDGHWAMAPLRLIANFQMPVYVAQAAPDITPMSSWLLPHLVSKPTQIGWTIAMNLLWIAGFVLAAWALGAMLWTHRRAVSQLDKRIVLAGTTLFCASTWCVSQVVRNVYEASFVLPLLALSFALALSTPLPPRLTRCLSRVATTIGLALPISAIAILWLYGPSLAQEADKGGYLPGQSYSVGLAHYGTLRAQIQRAAAACGITPQSHPAHLLIDDITYFTFMDSALPDHKTSVLEPRWSGSVTDPLAYLRQQHSSGVVLACNALPPALRARAKATGEVCCIGPDQWPAR